MRKGFTVGELLMVAVMVGILASILVPVAVGAVMERAEVVCQANLRELGLACLLYVQDNDGKRYVPLDFLAEVFGMQISTMHIDFGLRSSS